MTAVRELLWGFTPPPVPPSESPFDPLEGVPLMPGFSRTNEVRELVQQQLDNGLLTQATRSLRLFGDPEVPGYANIAGMVHSRLIQEFFAHRHTSIPEIATSLLEVQAHYPNKAHIPALLHVAGSISNFELKNAHPEDLDQIADRFLTAKITQDYLRGRLPASVVSVLRRIEGYDLNTTIYPNLVKDTQEELAYVLAVTHPNSHPQIKIAKNPSTGSFRIVYDQKMIAVARPDQTNHTPSSQLAKESTSRLNLSPILVLPYHPGQAGKWTAAVVKQSAGIKPRYLLILDTQKFGGDKLKHLFPEVTVESFALDGNQTAILVI